MSLPIEWSSLFEIGMSFYQSFWFVLRIDNWSLANCCCIKGQTFKTECECQNNFSTDNYCSMMAWHLNEGISLALIWLYLSISTELKADNNVQRRQLIRKFVSIIVNCVDGRILSISFLFLSFYLHPNRAYEPFIGNYLFCRIEEFEASSPFKLFFIQLKIAVQKIRMEQTCFVLQM